MGGFGMGEILLIMGILLLLFGAKKIPELMRGMGRGVREFTDAKDAPRTTEQEKPAGSADRRDEDRLRD